MHFGLSDEQLAMHDTARRFAEERLAPRYREREAEARTEPVNDIETVAVSIY